MPSKLSIEFLDKIKSKLLARKREIENEMKDLDINDPFMRDYRDDGSRERSVDLGDQTSDILERETNDMEEDVLRQEYKAVQKALHKIEQGTYGVSEKSGQSIPEDRLEANPTAANNVDE